MGGRLAAIPGVLTFFNCESPGKPAVWRTSITHPDGLPSADRPWIFGLLIAPSAVITNGVVQGGVLSYLLTQQGMKIDVIAHWLTLLALPTSLYFLYSPVTDFLLKRRTWLLLSALCAAGLMLSAFSQKSMAGPAPLRLILLSGCVVQLVVASCGGMLGTLHSDAARNAAGSFFQAGAMASGAIATWLLIRESSRVSNSTLGWMVVALVIVPSLFALIAPRQPIVLSSGLLSTLKILGNECKATFLRRDAIPYLIFLGLPAGTGSAIGLLPGIARFYGVSGDQVAWINGLLGAFAIAAGSMMTALVPARWSVMRVALIVYFVPAGGLALMAFGPMRPWTYLVSTVIYLFATGCSYSIATAVLLEFLGASGKSGSGRYSVLNGIVNIPVLILISVDGWAAAKWGTRGLPGIECVIGLLTCLPMLVYVCLRPPRRTVIQTQLLEI